MCDEIAGLCEVPKYKAYMSTHATINPNKQSLTTQLDHYGEILRIFLADIGVVMFKCQI